jgi:hypothetical protein
LNQRQPIVRAIHGFLGPNQAVQVQNPKLFRRERNFHGTTERLFVVANPRHFAKAVENAQIGFKPQVFEPLK